MKGNLLVKRQLPKPTELLELMKFKKFEPNGKNVD